MRTCERSPLPPPSRLPAPFERLVRGNWSLTGSHVPANTHYSVPIALAAQVPDIHKTIRRCLETAQYLEAAAQKVASWVRIAPFGVLDIDKLASWVWAQSEHAMGQPSSVSVSACHCLCVRLT